LTALYLLKLEYIEAANRLQNLDLDAATVIDTLDGMGGDLEEKATNTIMVCRNLKATAAAIKEAEGAMSARRKAIENRAAHLEKGVFDAMLETGISRIESPYFALSIANNPGAVDVFEPGLLPADYMREVPAYEEPDKALIGKALKAGFDVPGARLVQSQRLSVK
jgi:hypothetical protein